MVSRAELLDETAGALYAASAPRHGSWPSRIRSSPTGRSFPKHGVSSADDPRIRGLLLRLQGIHGGDVCVLEEPGPVDAVRSLVDGRLPRGSYTTLALSYAAAKA